MPLKGVNSANVSSLAARLAYDDGCCSSRLVSSGCRSSRPWMRNPRICGKGNWGKGKERIARRHDEREGDFGRERLGSITAPLAFCGRTHIIHEPIRAERERHREAEREGKEKRGGEGERSG